ncbi:MAG: CvpA family protein [Gammaproteobacteria bacterium]|nr:CvpA family protein [Gammaproteobacteria bacterium]
MNWADIAILIILGISALISVMRGFVREVMSIVAWVVAFWAAYMFTPVLAALLDPMISVPSVRHIAAFLAILIVTLILAALVNYLIGRLIEKTGLSGTDRALGVIFGVVRGVAIVAILVILARGTPVKQDPWWQQSVLMPRFDQLAGFIVSYFPESFGRYFE